MGDSSAAPNADGWELTLSDQFPNGADAEVQHGRGVRHRVQQPIRLVGDGRAHDAVPLSSAETFSFVGWRE
jgi:hypothetical protein